LQVDDKTVSNGFIRNDKKIELTPLRAIKSACVKIQAKGATIDEVDAILTEFHNYLEGGRGNRGSCF
jgi:hypothetical protein